MTWSQQGPATAYPRSANLNAVAPVMTQNPYRMVERNYGNSAQPVYAYNHLNSLPMPLPSNVGQGSFGNATRRSPHNPSHSHSFRR